MQPHILHPCLKKPVVFTCPLVDTVSRKSLEDLVRSFSKDAKVTIKKCPGFPYTPIFARFDFVEMWEGKHRLFSA